jgi:hypothetical protein
MGMEALVMNPRRIRRRALRGIERDLAASDPRLDELFLLFAGLARGAKILASEKIRTTPRRLLARLGPQADRHRTGEDGRAQPWTIFLGPGRTGRRTGPGSAVRPASITGCKRPPHPVLGVVLLPFVEVHVVAQQDE